MRSTVKSPLYFSSYPLKAVKEPSRANAEPSSPYLKALLSGKTKTTTPVRVLPRIRPHQQPFKQVPAYTGKLTRDIELTAKEWFNNYE